MHAAITPFIEAIHATPIQAVVVTAGAGSQAVAWLMGVPGASGTMLEALVPYSWHALEEFLDQKPKQAVNPITARLMAGRAFTRARLLRSGDEAVVGLACTATIVTNRPKKGAHRAHIATWQNERLIATTLTMHKGARTRQEEEALVSQVMLNALATAVGLTQQLSLPLLPEDELTVETVPFAATAQQLHAGDIPFFGVHDTGRLRTQDVAPQVLLPGSFNPLHHGHLDLARAAGQWLEKPVAFELSASNVDKPTLSTAVILDRLAQFAGRWPIYMTAAPTFLEKARLFANCTFVVGYDTAARILQPRYYNNSIDEMAAALAEIEARGCKFLVAGRTTKTGRYHDAATLGMPPRFTHLFQPIPQNHFRRDISSSELRAAGVRGAR